MPSLFYESVFQKIQLILASEKKQFNSPLFKILTYSLIENCLQVSGDTYKIFYSAISQNIKIICGSKLCIMEY